MDLAEEGAKKLVVHRIDKGTKYPWIVINGVFIGSLEELEELAENDCVMDIVNQLYLKMCIICKSLRISLEMEFC